MHIGEFPCEVVVCLPSGGGDMTTVANVIEAAECLTFDWPMPAGRRHEQAQAICIAVLDGRVDEQEARAAFLLAAEEANIPILFQ